MIVNCRIDDCISHTVYWKSLASGSMFRYVQKSKIFNNFILLF